MTPASQLSQGLIDQITAICLGGLRQDDKNECNSSKLHAPLRPTLVLSNTPLFTASLSDSPTSTKMFVSSLPTMTTDASPHEPTEGRITEKRDACTGRNLPNLAAFSTPMMSLSRLPRKLIEKIVDDCSDCRRTLQALSLATRLTRRRAQAHLFYALDVLSEQHIYVLLGLLDRNYYIAAAVQTLSVSFQLSNDWSGGACDSLRQILDCCVNLRTFRLSGSPFETRLGRSLIWPETIPTILSLELDQGAIQDLGQLVQLLERLPCLQQFTSNLIAFDITGPLPSGLASAALGVHTLTLKSHIGKRRTVAEVEELGKQFGRLFPNTTGIIAHSLTVTDFALLRVLVGTLSPNLQSLTLASTATCAAFTQGLVSLKTCTSLRALVLASFPISSRATEAVQRVLEETEGMVLVTLTLGFVGGILSVHGTEGRKHTLDLGDFQWGMLDAALASRPDFKMLVIDLDSQRGLCVVDPTALDGQREIRNSMPLLAQKDMLQVYVQ